MHYVLIGIYNTFALVEEIYFQNLFRLTLLLFPPKISGGVELTTTTCVLVVVSRAMPKTCQHQETSIDVFSTHILREISDKFLLIFILIKFYR